MKVLFVSQMLGVAAYRGKLGELARHVEVAAVIPNDSEPEPRGKRPYRLIHAPLIPFGHVQLRWFMGARRILQAERPDLVHIEDEPFSLVAFDWARIARGMRIPYLFFTWQNIFKRYPFPVRNMERFVHAGGVGAIVGNAEAESVLRRKGFYKPVRRIPQVGVDPERFQPPADAPAKDRPFTVGFIGRLVPEKGLDGLLTAFGSLPADMRLRFVGDGRWKRTLERQRKLQPQLARRIELRKAVPSRRVAEQLHEIDVLVLPSLTRPNWKEQFGRILIEAMAAGVPVVGSDSGELPHVIADAGRVVPEGDVKALERALLELRDDHAGRGELIARGRKRVLEHFTHGIVADQTAAFYKDLLG